MRLVRVGLGSIDTTVGAFRENTDRALALAHDMAADGVTVGVFPEQAIGGYPVEDLIQWQGFVERQWAELERFARETAGLATVFVIGVSVLHDGLRYNCAATVAGGSIRSLTPKEKLPTYNVFYEGRTVSRGVPGAVSDVRGVPFGDLVVRFDFGTIAPEVCEDLWSPEGPTKRRTYSGAELVCNVSASPFRLGVVQTRRELIATRAADYQCCVRLRQSRRRQRRADLRRRRLPQPERQVDAGGAALARRFRGRDHRSRSHHPIARGEHHLAHRRGGIPGGPRAGDHHRRAVRRVQHRLEPRRADLPGAGPRLLLPPGTRAAAIAA